MMGDALLGPAQPKDFGTVEAELHDRIWTKQQAFAQAASADVFHKLVSGLINGGVSMIALLPSPLM